MDRDALLAYGDDNLAATLRHHARTAADARVEDGGLLLISTSRTWPGPYHNGVLRLDRSLDPEDVLGKAERFFSERCPAYCVWIAQHADLDLEQAALDAGYASISSEGAPRMALEHPLAAPPRSSDDADVALVEVDEDRQWRDYLTVTVDAYADSFLPADAAEAQLASLDAVRGAGVRSVVAYDGGRPVAAAMSVASGPVAGVQLVGTVRDARGRGLGEACTRWAVDAGFASGADAIVLEASEMGEPLYRRMGFTEVTRYRWCLGPPGDRGRSG